MKPVNLTQLSVNQFYRLRGSVTRAINLSSLFSVVVFSFFVGNVQAAGLN